VCIFHPTSIFLVTHVFALLVFPTFCWLNVTGYGVAERKPDYGYWVWKSDLFGLRVWEIKTVRKMDLRKVAILWIWGLELVMVHGKAWTRSQAGNDWNPGGRRVILDFWRTSRWRGVFFLWGGSSCSCLAYCWFFLPLCQYQLSGCVISWSN